MKRVDFLMIILSHLASALIICESHHYMVPGYRRRSSCGVYYDNDDSSPERYRYRSPIQEPPYQPYRNVHDVQQPINRRADNAVPINNRNTPSPNIQHVHPANQHPQHTHHNHPVHQEHHTHKSPRGNATHHGRHDQHHNRYDSPNRFKTNHGEDVVPDERKPPAFSHHTKHDIVAEERSPVARKTGRAHQPLVTGPRAASNDRYAAPHCPYDQPTHTELKCANNYNWVAGKYVKDDCGSGIVTNPCDSRETRDNWCKTPLSIYQSSICELGRQLLCGEIKIPRKIIGAPPCNVCENIIPPCHGYYRKYEKLPPCEEKYIKVIKGKKIYRDKVKRYWEPCDLIQAGPDEDIRQYSGHNAYLAMKLNTQHDIDNLDF